MKQSIKNLNYVLVRTFSAGVFAGYLKSKKDKEVELLNVRRIWYSGDGSGSGSSTKEKRKEIEKIILERIPDNELPLYLNIWEFQETKTLLEKRLKNI